MKRFFLRIILDLLFIIFFNAILYFLTGFSLSKTEWIVYGFIHFAYIMFFLTTFMGEKTKESYLLSLSNFSFSAGYLAVCSFVGFFLFFFKHNSQQLSWRLSASIFIGITFIYFVLLIANLLANNSTAEKENTRDNSITNKSEVQTILKSLVQNTDDPLLKNKINEIIEKIHYAPLKNVNGQVVFNIQFLQKIKQIEEQFNSNSNNLEIQNIVNKIDNLF